MSTYLQVLYVVELLYIVGLSLANVLDYWKLGYREALLDFPSVTLDLCRIQFWHVVSTWLVYGSIRLEF